MAKSPLLRGLGDEELLKGKGGFCANRKAYTRCPARAYGITGDSLDEEPMCVNEPKITVPTHDRSSLHHTTSTLVMG